MRIDIPWPMPRWVMSSASHMTKAVPAVRQSTMKAASGSGELRDEVDARGSAEQARVVAVEDVDEPGRLHEGQGDGQVPGGLGELLLPDRPLVAPLLELRDHRREQLDDDRAGDVGHDAEPEDGEPDERAAGEQVEEPEDPRGARGVLELLDPREADPGHGDVRPELVQRDDEQGEQDLVAQVRDPEDVAAVW